LLGYSLMNSGNLKGINWQLRFSHKTAGNYRNAADGYVYNSGFNETDINGYAGINRKWGYSQLNFTSFNQVIAMTEGTRDAQGRFTKSLPGDSMVTVSASDLKSGALDVPYQQVRHSRIFLTNQFF